MRNPAKEFATIVILLAFIAMIVIGTCAGG